MRVAAPILGGLCASLICVAGIFRTFHVGVLAQSSLPPGFVDAVVLSGLSSPTAVRFSPDGRVFVAEKSGIIKVFDNLSDSAPTVFADLRTNVHNYWDRGLLGMALDPGFPTRPFVYLLYTFDGPVRGIAPQWGFAGTTSDGCPDPPGGATNGCTVSGRLSRLRADGNIATGGETVLVHDWFQQFPSHSMGSIVFGPDGALYASGGDGASWQFADYGQRGNPNGDPPVGVGGVQTPPTAEGGALRAQDVRTITDPTGLNGAVIRIDPNTGQAPPDNPLASSTDPYARRIVAYGLRNPFRMAFRPGTRELWVGDVGWRVWEEINRIVDPLEPTVRNFGWPCYEGSARQAGYDAADLNLCESLYAQPGRLTAAHFQYQAGGAVVAGESCSSADSATSGLAFYQGGSYPARYAGALFFADYARRCIWTMPPGISGVPDPARRETFVQGAANPVDLQTGPGGDLFYVDIVGGAVHRVRYQADNGAPTAVATAMPTSGTPPLSVSFDGRQSSDPEGTALSYRWDLDGDGAFDDSTAPSPTYVYRVGGIYSARLRVTDADGLSADASLSIAVGRPPTPVIDTPTSALRWRVGQAVSFAGHASDPEQGALAASALTWSLVMNHCASETSCHQHAIQEYRSIARGTFVAPDHDYPSYLTLRLTAIDAAGLQNSTTVRLDPQTVGITVRSNPAGLRLGFGAESTADGLPRTLIAGATRTVSAPSPQLLGGVRYLFRSWSDNGAQTHNIVAESNQATYVAAYAAEAVLNPSDRVLYAGRAAVRTGAWRVTADSTAAGGARMEQPDAGAPKIGAPLASPQNYFELSFDVEARRAYRLWARGRAHLNSYQNDSVYVQFSGSTDASGAPAFRIGTTSGAPVSIEACTGCGLAGWGWQDNGYGGDGPLIYFAAAGSQTIRVQAREDGVSLDQIVLSPVTYLSASPGATRNDVTLLPEQVRTGLPSTIVRYTSSATRAGAWRIVSDPSAAEGRRLENPDRGTAKLTTALAAPTDYFELAFNAEAGRPYRLWIRGRAHGDSYTNDSVFVQFSGSVSASGAAVYRIGTTDATSVVLEDCGGCGMSGWGWQDNGYGIGVLGPPIYFATTGPQTIRIQRREDGISIDHVVLSSTTYFVIAPGAARDDATILSRTP